MTKRNGDLVQIVSLYFKFETTLNYKYNYRQYGKLIYIRKNTAYFAYSVQGAVSTELYYDTPTSKYSIHISQQIFKP